MQTKVLQRVVYQRMALELLRATSSGTPMSEETRHSLGQMMLHMTESSGDNEKVLAELLDKVIRVLVYVRNIASLETGETDETESVSGVRV